MALQVRFTHYKSRIVTAISSLEEWMKILVINSGLGEVKTTSVRVLNYYELFLFLNLYLFFTTPDRKNIFT